MPTSKNLEISELARKITVSDTSVTLTGVTFPSSTLENTGVTAGNYGSASQVPVLTVNAKGQVTAASTTNVAGVSTFTYTSGTKTLNISTADGGSFDAALSNLATETYVNSAIANLVDSSPSTLDTLNEIAAALGDDANFATTVTAALGTKASNDDLVALENYVNARLPSGFIGMWSGSIASIPSGWALCNGSNGTPDLRNRFIVGAGSTYAVDATGGSADAIVVSHTHTATSVVTDPGHNHAYSQAAAISPGSGGSLGGGDGNLNTTISFNIPNKNTGITVATTNASAGTSGTNANLPPYYALAYIMKV